MTAAKKRTAAKKKAVPRKERPKKKSVVTKQTNRKKLSLTLKCGENFSLRDVQEFHQQLTKALESKQSVEVDASKVTQADTAGLQLLYAFSKKANDNGLEFKWKKVSDDFRKTAELLGMSECLDLPSNL